MNPDCNIFLLGESGSGRSCLARRWAFSYFDNDIDPTIEDTYRRQIEKRDGKAVVVEAVKPGYSEYERVPSWYLRQTYDCVLVVYDERTLKACLKDFSIECSAL